MNIWRIMTCPGGGGDNQDPKNVENNENCSNHVSKGLKSVFAKQLLRWKQSCKAWFKNDKDLGENLFKSLRNRTKGTCKGIILIMDLKRKSQPEKILKSPSYIKYSICHLFWSLLVLNRLWWIKFETILKLFLLWWTKLIYFRKNAPLYITTKIWLTSTDMKNNSVLNIVNFKKYRAETSTCTSKQIFQNYGLTFFVSLFTNVVCRFRRIFVAKTTF